MPATSLLNECTALIEHIGTRVRLRTVRNGLDHTHGHDTECTFDRDIAGAPWNGDLGRAAMSRVASSAGPVLVQCREAGTASFPVGPVVVLQVCVGSILGAFVFSLSSCVGGEVVKVSLA